ncbi:MAG: hypothetical protein V4739_04120 [Pseudomonadota bacterium]
MRHFMDNSGRDVRVDMRELMNKSRVLKFSFDNELFQAREFCQTLAPGVHSITSEECGRDDFEQGNLHLAFGSYKFWGQGRAAVTAADDRTDKRTCLLEFTFHFFDRYNWDVESEKKAKVAPGIYIQDKTMAKFHTQCLAKEYDLHGQLAHKVSWNYLWR